MDIVKLLETQAQKYPQRPAIIFQGQTITFSQVKESSFKLANSLIKLGVKKKDKIAIYLPNCPEYIYSYLACWSIGATCVPLDFMLTQEEARSCISHSEAKFLIAKSKPTISWEELQKNSPQLKNIILFHEQREKYLSFEQLLNTGTSDIPCAEVKDTDSAIIFYTSGTTGKPKGVLVSYLQLGASPRAMEYFVNLGDKDIALCALPLSHVGGLVFLQGMMFLGTTVVLMERFIPLEFLKNVQNYKITCFWLVPSMYYAILQLKEFESIDLSSLNWIVSFGAPSSADQLRRFHQYCPRAELVHGWGMTETNAPSIVLPLGSKKIESVGKPVPWLEVKIFSAAGADDNEKEVPVGQIGEIVVKGWVVTDGYYKDPEITALAMRNGWFHTGDLGRFDEEGYLYIVGRKKEMIKVGGEIVFEPEVEAAVHKHPDVAEVAVIGVADKLRGEVPKAFVVLKTANSLSQEDLRYFLRGHLAHFKIPHQFEFRNSLPKTRTDKIDKERLKKEAL